MFCLGLITGPSQCQSSTQFYLLSRQNHDIHLGAIVTFPIANPFLRRLGVIAPWARKFWRIGHRGVFRATGIGTKRYKPGHVYLLFLDIAEFSVVQGTSWMRRQELWKQKFEGTIKARRTVSIFKLIRATMLTELGVSSMLLGLLSQGEYIHMEVQLHE
jgi:hypothetical protein